MKKSIAAYLYFFTAGISVACLGIGLLDGINGLIDVVRHPGWDMTPLLVLPGAGAIIAALMVQAPFLRAVRARRRAGVYGWTVLGVIAAHATYAVLVFWLVVVSENARAAIGIAGAIGFMSLILGFLPNVLFGICFAEFLLARNRRAGLREAEAGSARAQHA